MKISTKGRYALRALVDLAELHDNGKGTVSLKDIAARQNISLKYLENLFMSLKAASIVKSRRGAGGGYYLARKADKISAFEVIQAIEGPVSIVECCTSEDYCRKKKKCKTVNLWENINNQIIRELKQTTVEDLV